MTVEQERTVLVLPVVGLCVSYTVFVAWLVRRNRRQRKAVAVMMDGEAVREVPLMLRLWEILLFAVAPLLILGAVQYLSS